MFINNRIAAARLLRCHGDSRHKKKDYDHGIVRVRELLDSFLKSLILAWARVLV